MKNKLSKILLIGICLFIIYFIIINNKVVHDNIIYAINLWITKVFPSLFPMFIINDVLIYSGFPVIISKLFGKITYKLFRISGTSAYVFFMSIFSGTPANAIILKSLVDSKEISEKEASITLAFTFFSNPLFLHTMLNGIFPSSVKLKIILIYYLVNVIIILLFRKELQNIINTSKIIDFDNNNFAKTLNNSIKRSMNTLLMILGTITFYVIISTIILNSFDFNPLFETIIKGFLEITQGLNSLSDLCFNSKIKEIIAITIISFGGLSVHTQVINIISETKIKYNYFLMGRILHVIISVILIIVF